MKRSTTKRALLMSGLAMLLSISMLVGTTFAWFTDSVSSANNVIVAGNLDVELEYWNGEEWLDVAGKADILTNKLWEPGVTEVAYLRVANAGSLALKYQLGINIVSEKKGVNKDGDEFLLSDHIMFGVVENVNGETNAYANREAAVAAVTGAKKISEGYTKAEAMESGDVLYLALVVYMPTTVGNEANHNGEDIPQIDLGINIFATQATAEEDSFDEYYDGGAKWLGGIDTSWYTDTATEFVIGNPEQLAGLAQLVNTGVDSFSGKTVKLASDLDLNNINWTPIGSFDYDRDAQAYANAVTFKGIFDGQGHTINNLKINTPNTEGAALFGCVEAATIKNVNVHNVDIVAGGHAAAILARGYNYSKTTTVTNCHVTGDIEILIDWAYAGGIVAKATGLNISACSVKPTETGVITASNRNAVGGIVGWVEAVGASTISNCQVANMKLTGWANIGSINGYVQAGCTINNCSAENIVLTKTRVDGHPTIGLVAGGFSYNATQPVTITNNTVKNITLNGTHIAAPASANILYGAEFSGNANSNFVLDNNTTTENITNNLVEIVAVKDAAGLKAALANGGDNYVLTKDIVVANNETITVANGTTVVIDLNGYTISSTADKTGNQELFLVKGNLTVKNGSIEYAASNNQGWGAMITIFDVTAGGAITLDAVQASVDGSDMNFVAHLNNWGSASATITNCDFDLSYVAVRAYNSGYDMNTVTIKNTDVTGGARLFWVHNYTSEGKGDSTLTLNIYNNGNTCGNAKPVRFGFSNESYYNLEGKKIVSTADELVAAVKDGKNVILTGNLANVPVNNAAPYGNKCGIAQNGGVLDGNNFALDFDSIGDNYCIMTSGGTIKNLTVGGGFRGIMIMSPTETVYIDNVTICDPDVVYAINTGEGDSTQSLVVSNSTIGGWTSLSEIKDATFTNCTFIQGKAYSNVTGRLVRPYVNTTFTNCEFISGFYIDLSALKADQKIVLENCTVNGVKLTAENWTTLIATESACGEGQISIELRDGSYMTAENVADYVIIK